MSEGNNLPTVEELKGEIASTGDAIDRQSIFERKFRSQSVQIEADYAHLRGLIDHYKHKGRWSYFLMGLLILMIVFQSVLLGLVGVGVWDFTKYDWLLPALLVQNLGQIIALAYVVVKSLFR